MTDNPTSWLGLGHLERLAVDHRLAQLPGALFYGPTMVPGRPVRIIDS